MPPTRPAPRAPALPAGCDYYRGWPLKYLGHRQQVKEPGYRIYAPWTGQVLFVEPNRAEAERRIDQQVQVAEEASARATRPPNPAPAMVVEPFTPVTVYRAVLRPTTEVDLDKLIEQLDNGTWLALDWHPERQELWVWSDTPMDMGAFSQHLLKLLQAPDS